MRSPASSAVTVVNADIGGEISSLRILGAYIVAVGVPPKAGDQIVDLQGDRLLPGLINAHDHLQLNNLPQIESTKIYRHVQDWISDINLRRKSDPSFEARVAIATNERLMIGGVKNLLSGVTTVAHHDRPYQFLSHSDFPIKIVSNYGWSHSLYIDGESKVRESFARTPAEWPWIIHAAEGLDTEAASEFDCLDALGCIGSNTLLVHGIALSHAQQMRICQVAAGLIWCPSSNLSLFGKTAEVSDLVARGRVALGTDSRLSGARDILDELHVARKVSGLDDKTLESLVTDSGARLLRLADRGVLSVGARADILILPARTQLSMAIRADVRLVMVDGAVRYGDKHCALSFAPSTHWREVQVDGAPKVMDNAIAMFLSNASVHEDGLELLDVAGRAA